MIEYIPSSVVYHCSRIRSLDPFQSAVPMWQDRSFLSLLPESEFTPITKENTNMAVKFMSADKVPVRKIVRAPQVAEITEVLEALKKMSPTQAIEVSLCADTVKRYSANREGKKTIPARQVAAALKRKFTADGLAYTAYTPDGVVVIVVREK